MEVDDEWLPSRYVVQLLKASSGEEGAKKLVMDLCAAGRMPARAFRREILDGMSVPLTPGRHVILEARSWIQGAVQSIDWDVGNALVRYDNSLVELDDLRFARAMVESLAPAARTPAKEQLEPRKDTRPTGSHAGPIALVTLELGELTRQDLQMMKATHIAEKLHQAYVSLKRVPPGKRNLDRFAADLREVLLGAIETD